MIKSIVSPHGSFVVSRQSNPFHKNGHKFFFKILSFTNESVAKSRIFRKFANGNSSEIINFPLFVKAYSHEKSLERSFSSERNIFFSSDAVF